MPFENGDDIITFMSKMVKAHWTADQQNIHLSMPIAKVDTEKRLVSGYATLDNLDSQGDVVLAEASKAAFARARGNIREMHDSVAVGRLVDFREDEYYDTETQKFYRGIYVTAYVSKGAPNTWEKVVDGTLTGFSIGGSIKEATNEFVKDANGGEGANVRFIKEYDLVELSLVDNPANQLANVFSIQKSLDGSVTKMTGMVAETSIENIFWCETDGVARTLDSETAQCLICDSDMKNIGWVESGEQKTEKVKEVVSKYLSQEAAPDDSEGGVDVSKFEKSETPAEGEVVAGIDEGREVDTQATEAEAQTTEPAAEQPGEDTTPAEEPHTPAEGEVVAGIDEVPDENEEVSKKLDALHETLIKTLETTKKETSELVGTLNERVDTLDETFKTKTSEWDTKFEELGTKLEAAKSALTDFEKSLEVINSNDAIKKSADVEKSAGTKPEEPKWNGAFSVNNLLR